MSSPGDFFIVFHFDILLDSLTHTPFFFGGGVLQNILFSVEGRLMQFFLPIQNFPKPPGFSFGRNLKSEKNEKY